MFRRQWTRFFHLERPRRKDVTKNVQPNVARFERLELGTDPLPGAAPSLAQLTHQSEPSLTTAPEPITAADAEPAFVTCWGCGVENSPWATTCRACDLPLTSDGQMAQQPAPTATRPPQPTSPPDCVINIEQVLRDQRRASNEAFERELREQREDHRYDAILWRLYRHARKIEDPRLRIAALVTVGVVPIVLLGALFFGNIFGQILAGVVLLILTVHY